MSKDTRDWKAARAAQRRETEGRTRNLKEDLTTRDLAQLEVSARKAMGRNAQRLTGQSSAGETGSARQPRQAPAPASAGARREWTEAELDQVSAGMDQGMSAKRIQAELLPHMAPGVVRQQVRIMWEARSKNEGAA